MIGNKASMCAHCARLPIGYLNVHIFFVVFVYVVCYAQAENGHNFLGVWSNIWFLLNILNAGIL